MVRYSYPNSAAKTPFASGRLMTSNRLWERFEVLHASSDASTSSAVAIESSQSHLLIKGSAGEPILLLKCDPRMTPRAPIRLKHIGVVFDRTFEVKLTAEAAPIIGHYAQLTCSPESISLHRWFVELVGAVSKRFPGPMIAADVDELLTSLLELFRQTSPPTDAVILGLWGELFAISISPDPGKFVKAWHTSPTETFDFNFSALRLEVKTTQHQIRQHDFALGQLTGKQATDFILSIITRRATAGESVLTIAKKIAETLDGALEERLWRIIFETLGSELDGVDEWRFDVETAMASTKLFQAKDIPAPAIPPCQASVISDVRFRVMLGDQDNDVPLTTLL